MIEKLIEYLQALSDDERIDEINKLQQRIFDIHPIKQPVSAVKWVPSEQVVANSWNPNSVAPPEMRLLYTSIKEDGYTQPIVALWDEEKRKYVVVDGFHRNRVGKEYKDISKSTMGRLPVVTLDKPIQDRMASTIRHNRARGKHSVLGMKDIVVELIGLGWDDQKIAMHLGMDAEEVLRLKQVSGIAEVFKSRDYSRSWILDPEQRK